MTTVNWESKISFAYLQKWKRAVWLPVNCRKWEYTIKRYTWRGKADTAVSPCWHTKTGKTKSWMLRTLQLLDENPSHITLISPYSAVSSALTYKARHNFLPTLKSKQTVFLLQQICMYKFVQVPLCHIDTGFLSKTTQRSNGCPHISKFSYAAILSSILIIVSCSRESKVQTLLWYQKGWFLTNAAK